MNLAAVITGHDASKVALIDGEDHVTYGALRRQVAAMQVDLGERGVGLDTTVALATGNDAAFVVSSLAVLGLGGIVMPLNPGSPTSELARKLEAADPTMILVGHAGRLHLGDTSLGTPTIDLIEMLAIARSAEDGPTEPTIVDRDDDTPAFYMATSGVSGAAKVAVLSHHNLRWIHAALREVDPPLSSTDVTIGSLPFTHIFGLNVVLMATLDAGATLVLQERFDAEGSLRLVSEHGVTSLTGAPPMWKRWLEADVPDDSLASVQFASSGAAALPVEVFEGVKQRFGIEIAQGYGLTETSPVVTLGRGAPVRPTSVGRVLPGVEVALVDDSGTPVDIGDEGEIVVRSPGVFMGYLNDQASSEAALSDDGWLWTGDIGIFDEDGYLYLVDRIKDIIIVSGFNVYPAEVENVLMQHPKVSGVIATGVADELTGETVVAHVAGTATQDELEQLAAEHLSRYKRPTQYYFL
ncbi:class I adenylate-forming enzyme family protein, partial [Ilumatobacter sp.]|uniref:class I adenylate-forming enzyme family protein n=1 Tax=Ilumatobacter sp. TaxID=1967498 RepID=UPI003C41F744